MAEPGRNPQGSESGSNSSSSASTNTEIIREPVINFRIPTIVSSAPPGNAPLPPSAPAPPLPPNQMPPQQINNYQPPPNLRNTFSRPPAYPQEPHERVPVPRLPVQQMQPIPPGPPPPVSAAQAVVQTIDQASNRLLNEEIPQTHNRPEPVVERINEGLGFVHHTLRQNAEGWVGPQFTSWLKSLMLPNERLLLGSGLEFSKLLIWDYDLDPEHTGQPETTLTRGMIVITDRRILFTSYFMVESASVEKHGENARRPPGNYQLKGAIEDCKMFFSVPHSSCKSVSLEYKSKNTAVTNVEASKPKLCCSRFYGCCWPKVWEVKPTTVTFEDQRLVKLGVLLPPWMRRMDIQAFVFPEMPIRNVCEFISAVQYVCPMLPEQQQQMIH